MLTEAPRHSAGPDLTADQLLALYNALPTSEELERDPDGALASLRQWRRDHPDEQTRFPAPTVLQIVLRNAERHRIRTIRSPVAGTYRVTVSLPDRDSLVFFARTTLHPRFMLDALTDSAANEQWRKGGDFHAVGYYLVAAVALTRKELPQETADYRDASRRPEGTVAVVEVPIIDTRDSTVWQGSFDVIGAAIHLAPPGRFLDRLVDASSIISGSITNRRSYAPGHLVRRPNGSMRYTMTEYYVGEPLVTVRADRVSLEYVTDPPRPSSLPPMP